MPGLGEYSTEEIESMSAMELVAAQQRGFKRPADEQTNVTPYTPPASETPAPIFPQGNVWAANRDAAEADGEDFVTPSGQKCRLRRITPEMLLPLGILDRLTRLEGLAQELIDRAEGLPPEKQALPKREDMEMLLDTLDLLMPVAVAEPRIYANDDEDAPANAIRVGHIDLMDRVAIMDRSLRRLKSLDRFRNAG